MKKFYIIDGNAYIHRAYHALPPLSTSKGRQVNAVYGFVKLLLKIKNNFKPDFLAVCFDYPSKNFRHNLFADYKANRKQLDDSLISQMPIARLAADALNISKVEIEGYEADDLIASISEKNKKEKIKTVIVTGDKDILQLVKDGEISVWNDSKDLLYNEQKVEEKYEIKPSQLLDMFALMGDVSDNVPGIKGIGEKTAVKLIKEFGSLEEILNNADKISGKTGSLIKEGKQSALISKELIALKRGAPIDYDLNAFEIKELNPEKAGAFFKEYEFKSLMEKYIGSNLLDTDIRQKSASVYEIKPIKIEPMLSEIIDNIESLQKVIAEIKEKKIVVIKTICSGQIHLKPTLIGISLCAGGKVYYIPIGHNLLGITQINLNDFKNLFSGILEDDKIQKIGFDLKHERNIYASLGVKLESVYFDIMLAAYCLNPSQSDIKTLAKEHLNFAAADDAYLGKASKKLLFENAQIEYTEQYANSFAYAAYNLYKKFDKDLEEVKLKSLFFDMEMPLLKVLSDMEISGIKIDKEFLKSFNIKISDAVGEIESYIFNLAGKEFNINSPKQLADIMFVKLNLPVVKKTKTGYSTDEEVLTELSDYEFAKAILQYRELQKLKSTYIDPITQYCSYYGDRIHTTFNQTITATGRLSSTDPNLQNIPIKSEYGREFRKAFICEKDRMFISADYSQIDLRVLAHISGDQKLIEAFTRGEDIHSATAREVFSIEDGGELPDKLRNAAKSINFGIVYGISPFGLSKQLGISMSDAKSYIDGYLQRYKGVKDWMTQVVNQAKQDGFVSTITGRIRFIPSLNSSNKQIVLGAQRMALNTPVQGSSADIIKIAMLNIYDEIKKKGYKTKMLLQVHDDLLFETPNNEIDIISALVKEKMESAVKLKVPLIVDIKKGVNWGEMKK
ncbi:MAG: DNA polymerase I [Elusimicrobiota bacterium]|jgi:DNA polymerase-1|nr:DNA polymerase I [Elusimicrobiota bacterium]